MTIRDNYLEGIAGVLGGSFDGAQLSVPHANCDFFLKLVRSMSLSEELLWSIIAEPMSTSGWLRVTRKIRSFPRFSVVSESFSDKIAKAVGLIDDFQSNDDEFDRRFLLFVESEDWGRRLFGDADVRKSVTQLFDLGFDELMCRNDELSVVLYPADLSVLPSAQAIVEAFGAMSNICGLFGRSANAV